MSEDESELRREIAGLLRAREGHFAYESAHHGRLWLDLELLFLHPDAIRPLAGVLARRLQPYGPTIVCGPLVEGAFVALLVAASLGVPFSYAEPVRDAGAAGLFPVSYRIPQALQVELRGQRVALVNDVINAGSAMRGTLHALEAIEARPVALATLAAYGDAARELARGASIDLEVLAAFPGEIWTASECPLCATGVPLDA